MPKLKQFGPDNWEENCDRYLGTFRRAAEAILERNPNDPRKELLLKIRNTCVSLTEGNPVTEEEKLTIAKSVEGMFSLLSTYQPVNHWK